MLAVGIRGADSGDRFREQMELEHKTLSIQSMRTAMICSAIGALAGAVTALVAVLAYRKRHHQPLMGEDLYNRDQLRALRAQAMDNAKGHPSAKARKRAARVADLLDEAIAGKRAAVKRATSLFSEDAAWPWDTDADLSGRR